jgi:hypothetical protein
MRRFFKQKQSTEQLRKRFFMSAQDDVNNTVAAINAAAATLTEAATQLSGLGIPAPIDTSALPKATSELATAVAAVQAAVTAEAGKITPAPAA